MSLPFNVGRQVVSEVELNKAYPNFVIGKRNSLKTLAIASNLWANKKYNVAGFPDFEITPNNEYGVFVFYGGFGFHDIPESTLHHVENRFLIGKENSRVTWARAVHRYAQKNKYDVGIPTFEIGSNGVRGAQICQSARNKWVDVSEAELARFEPNFKIGQDNDFDIWFRASNRWARHKRYSMGLPTFEIGENRVRGVTLLDKRPTSNAGDCAGLPWEFNSKSGYWVDCKGSKVSGYMFNIYDF